MAAIQQILQGLSHINLAKGTTVLKGEVPILKELEMFTTSLKREAGDVVSLTHRIRQTGKSPYVIADIQVKDKSGNIIDRLFASLSDWGKNGQSYSVKFRKGNAKPQKPAGDKLKSEIPTKSDKLIDKSKPDIPNKNDNVPKDVDNTPKPETTTKSDKPIDKSKPETSIENNKSVDKSEAERLSENKNVPKDVNTPKIPTAEDTLGGLVPHPTQHIQNVRDFEIDGLLNHDMETIVNMQKTGRQAFFDPMTEILLAIINKT